MAIKLVRQSDMRCSLPHSTGIDDDFYQLDTGIWTSTVEGAGTNAVGTLRGGQLVMTTAATDNSRNCIGLKTALNLTVIGETIDALVRFKLGQTVATNGFVGFSTNNSGSSNKMTDNGAGPTDYGFGYYFVDGGTNWKFWGQPDVAVAAQSDDVLAASSDWVTMALQATKISTSELFVTGMLDTDGGQNLLPLRGVSDSPRTPDVGYSFNLNFSGDLFLNIDLMAGAAAAKALTVDYVSVRQTR